MSRQTEAAMRAQAPLEVVEGGRATPRGAEEVLADMVEGAHPESDLREAEQPYYARRNKLGYYTYRGEQYKSVTTYLGYAPGGHLMLHYGRQAALKAASYLVIAGLAEPQDEKLKEFCEAYTQNLTPGQAFAAIMAWQANMLEAERYRDHKARIGSLGHHFIYSCAIGHLEPKVARDKDAIMAWLWQEALSLRLFGEQEPSEKQLDELCFSAYAYVLSSSDWLTIAKPRWEMVGSEAMVVRIGVKPGDGQFDAHLMKRCGLTPRQLASLPEPVQWLVLDHLAIRYAGTVDGHLTLVEGETGLKWHDEWPRGEASFWLDIKHCNSLSHTAVQAQISAYEDCDVIVLVQTGQEVELPKADLIASLHVGPHAEASGLQDEFGTLESHAKQLGARLYTYPRSPLPLCGFQGLTRFADFVDSPPRAHQQRRQSIAKPAPIPKTMPRSCPF